MVEFAPNHSGTTCMTMLIRTENCQEWLREVRLCKFNPLDP